MKSIVISVEEAALLLNHSTATVRRWCSTGRLVAKKVGRAWAIDARDPLIVRRVNRVLEIAQDLGIDIEKVREETKA